MHELALTEDILDSALHTARQQGALAIRQLTLTLSSASHLDPEALQVHFASISRGTPAEGAQLVFQPRTVEQTCWSCRGRFVVTRELGCPDCGAPAAAAGLGQELRLDSIELDLPADSH